MTTRAHKGETSFGGRGRGVRLLLRNDNLFSLSLRLGKNKIKEECANKKEKHVKYKMLTHTIAEVTHTHTHTLGMRANEGSSM